MVEFALILPMLLTLYFGSIEAGSLFTVDRRITIISGTVGDLISQWDPSGGLLTQTTIDDYFEAAEVIMTPYDATGLAQVVSFVEVDSTGVTEVKWSKATGGGTARTVGASYPLAASTQMNQIAQGGWLIVAETSYSYKPVLGLVFTDAVELSHISYFLPRFAECIQVSGSACP